MPPSLVRIAEDRALQQSGIVLHEEEGREYTILARRSLQAPLGRSLREPLTVRVAKGSWYGAPSLSLSVHCPLPLLYWQAVSTGWCANTAGSRDHQPDFGLPAVQQRLGPESRVFGLWDPPAGVRWLP